MRVRKILLVHPVRSTRGLIKKYIFSELGDIEILEAQSGEEAVLMRSTTDFDVILVADQLKDMRIAEVKQAFDNSQGSYPVPLIIISESESAQVRNELVEQGFDRVVQIRLRPSDLIQKINAVCDPRSWRKDTRYHLPNVRVQIEVQAQLIDAKLINISRGGILVELACDQPGLLMGEKIQLTLVVPEDDGLGNIDGLTARLSRIEVLDWHTVGSPSGMRATFIFSGLQPGLQSKLDELLHMAKTDKLSAC